VCSLCGTNCLYIYITYQSSVVTICTTMFHTHKFYILPAKCIYVSCVDLRTNSDYFPMQHSATDRQSRVSMQKKDIQTVDHLIYQCEKLKYERGILKNSVLKTDNWPISKSKLVNRNLKQLIRYINSVDLEKLNHSKSCK
jgi:hypothetical protein